jgi:hypothetical protein
MFLLPFNLVMLGVWSVMLGKVWCRVSQAPAGGAKVWDDGFQVRVRLTQFPPLAVGAAVAGGLAFVSIFLVGFGFGGFHPPMQVMLVVWPVILVGGLAGYVVYRWKLAQGTWDLVIDTMAGKVTLPPTMGRKMDVLISLEDIRSLEVQTVEKRGSKGSVSYCYVPVLAFADSTGAVQHEKLMEWWDEDRAQGLADWLRERLRIEPPKGSYAASPPRDLPSSTDFKSLPSSL